MDPCNPAADARIGLAIVDPASLSAELAEVLDAYEARATFFVRPEVLALEANRFRFLVAAGHELGDGCLIGATDDGRLRNWSCATLEAEIRESARLLRELGQAQTRSIYVPGRFHVCADGSYRSKLHSSFDVCVGEYLSGSSVNGTRGGIQLGIATGGRSVACFDGNPGNLLGVLKELPRGVSVGRVCELATH